MLYLISTSTEYNIIISKNTTKQICMRIACYFETTEEENNEKMS